MVRLTYGGGGGRGGGVRGRAVFSIFPIFIGAPVEYLWTFEESAGSHFLRFFLLALIPGMHEQFPCNLQVMPFV